MKVLAIVAEYNPLHNGHRYQIERAKEISGADHIIVIMSGSFTQQGNISILNKFDRANIAITEGADLVLELPTIYSLSSAEDFAFGAISILNSLGCIDYLSFGAECEDLDLLNNIVNKVSINEPVINDYISKNISNGDSFVKTRHNALKLFLDVAEVEEIEKPNNILAIEYLRALKKLNSTITPVIVKRQGAEHNSDLVTNVNNFQYFTSSTYIRNLIKASKYKNNSVNIISPLEDIIPLSCAEYLKTNPICLNENLLQLLRYKIFCMKPENIKNIFGVVEGLENRIYNSASNSLTYLDFVKSIKTKRFTESRIKRILINILLDITYNKYSKLKGVLYSRVLKVKNNYLLKKINKTSTIPIITTIKENKIKNLDNILLESLNLDISASNIREIANNSTTLTDFTNKI